MTYHITDVDVTHTVYKLGMKMDLEEEFQASKAMMQRVYSVHIPCLQVAGYFLLSTTFFVHYRNVNIYKLTPFNVQIYPQLYSQVEVLQNSAMWTHAKIFNIFLF